ncbi:hypothetical protein WR164_11880 [Philodulcilactobacillus myokoensis]|uniref:CBS domain-containing protein n=1 Tax=Philodulcilactobacillus myokoensis TaxID=2929573 RepID=A0A9W6B1G0_9LACO|nr:cyclic di-AMP binding protein CbpA [Philodulcilactobacillus myokoensis]GLB47209.1 hypothetical protein WR164_11880 [Philodulcilactobacillus myokoensis]
MLLKTLIKPKTFLTTVTENTTLQAALKILEEKDYRCIPILDKTGHIFRGNIYKMHIYRHKSRGGDMNLPVTTLIKNSTKFVNINSAFFHVFFTIKDLPYIAVLDDNNYFYGILTHTRLMGMLSQSWNVNLGGFVITVASRGERGDLAKMAKIIAKYTSIQSFISLDSQDSEMVQRSLFTLPKSVNEDLLKRIIAALKRKGFKVPEVEDLTKEN